MVAVFVHLLASWEEMKELMKHGHDEMKRIHSAHHGMKEKVSVLVVVF